MMRRHSQNLRPPPEQEREPSLLALRLREAFDRQNRAPGAKAG